MKVQLTSVNGVDAHLELDPAALEGVSVLLYNGQHYLFEGFGGKFHSTIRFAAIAPPLEVQVQKQPEPERLFFGKKG